MKAAKTIILGLDGLEPTVLEPLLAAGALPNLARLAAQGGYSRVATTLPAQTPVAWSTFATGVNPGGHGVFDFVRRDPRTYQPQFGLNHYEQRSPFVRPRVVNQRRGETIWEILTERGIPSVVLRCPCTYPPDQVQGRLLAGMGVPDLRGSLGTATFYTSRQQVRAGESESVVPLHVTTGNTVATHLLGPLNPKTCRPVTAPVTIQLLPADGKAIIRVDGQDQSVELRRGAWSEWLHVRFKVGVFQSVCGMVRFFLVRLDAELEFHASPLNFVPDEPLFPISWPPRYAADLAEHIGTFHTTGMVEDHGGLANGRIDEAAFLDQCERAWHEREAMLFHELDRFDEGFLFCLFDTPDRVQHMFWRFREPDHPSHATGEYSTSHVADYAQAIEEQYRRCDYVVGRALESADDQTLLVALSDHGFGTFRRGVHLNGWLLREGLLHLRDGVAPGPEAGDFLKHVDWPRTKAYALGLTGIFLNLRGREAQGLVTPDEAPRLKADIIRQLGALRDEPLELRAVRGVVDRERAYHGAQTHEAPDLLVNFAAGYRTSWETALGGVPSDVFSDNTRRWSGDHIVDPELVPGVLFMNREFRRQHPRLLDLAPTILGAMGVTAGAAMEGESLLV